MVGTSNQSVSEMAIDIYIYIYQPLYIYHSHSTIIIITIIYHDISTACPRTTKLSTAPNSGQVLWRGADEADERRHGNVSTATSMKHGKWASPYEIQKSKYHGG